MHTEELDSYVESLANVVGWEWVEDEGVARIFVTEKVSEEELDEEELVSNALEALGVETDVVAVGGEFRPAVVDLRREPDVRPAHTPTNRHRPVVDGVSEINAKSTAATAGFYPAKVMDTSTGFWSDDVEEGDTVRLSNNHVYARSNEAELGEPIIQPSPRDGGELDGDLVGHLLGYVPIEDGVTVDIAARSTNPDVDDDEKHDLPNRMGQGILRDYSSLRSSKVTKTGRTTGVSSGTVIATEATVNVRYPDGQVKIRDCILTTAMSQGGDSGSDVFEHTTGDYVGALFAGSPSATILCKASNIEKELGVQLPGKETSEEVSEEWWRALLRWLFRLFG